MKSALRSSQPKAPIRRARRLRGESPEIIPNAIDINAPQKRRRQNLGSAVQRSNDGTAVTGQSSNRATDAKRTDRRPQRASAISLLRSSDRASEHDGHTEANENRDAACQTVLRPRSLVFTGEEEESDYARRPPGMILVETGEKPVTALLPDWQLSQQLQAAVRAERNAREERLRCSSQLNALKEFQDWSFELRSELLDQDASQEAEESEGIVIPRSRERLVALQRRDSEARRDHKIIQSRLGAVEAEVKATQTAAIRALEPIFVDAKLMPPAYINFSKTVWDLRFDQRYAISERIEVVPGEREVQPGIDAQTMSRIAARREVRAATQRLQSAQQAFDQREALAQQEAEALRFQSGMRTSTNEVPISLETESQVDRHQLKVQMALTQDLVRAEEALEAAEFRATEMDRSDHDTLDERSSMSTTIGERPACLAKPPDWSQVDHWRRLMSLSSSSPPSLVTTHFEQDGALPDFKYDDDGLWESVSQASSYAIAKRSKVSEWRAVCEELRASMVAGSR